MSRAVKFDKDLAIAELERFEILFAHHLRRMKIAGDVHTAQRFHAKLGTMEHEVRITVKKMKEKRDYEERQRARMV